MLLGAWVTFVCQGRIMPEDGGGRYSEYPACLGVMMAFKLKKSPSMKITKYGLCGNTLGKAKLLNIKMNNNSKHSPSTCWVLGVYWPFAWVTSAV